MNVYQFVLEEAKQSEKSHYQRQAVNTRRWFAHHPECKYRLLPLNWHDEQIRSHDDKIAIEYRHGEGWWNRVTDDSWIGLPQQRGTRLTWGFQLPEESVSEQEYLSAAAVKRLAEEAI